MDDNNTNCDVSMLSASLVRLEVPVQASSFNPSQTSIEEGSRDE